jgi:transcriptional regulator with XRE-family HTH domain
MTNSTDQTSIEAAKAFDAQSFAEPLGETIRQIRKARGLSLDKLAAASGLTKQAVRRIETGAVANASVATLLKISEALGVRIGVLMFLAERAMNKDPSLVGHEMEDRLADFWYRATSALFDSEEG